MPDVAIGSDRVVLPDGVRPAVVVVAGGVITGILDTAPAGVPFVDATGSVVSPGLVDSHVHVNEPGRTHWEGFATATRAAAAGGVTTIVDMPLNAIPPVTSVAALEAKRAAAQGVCFVDVAFWGGLTSGDTREVGALADAGVCGFKVFLVDSGVPEYAHVSPAELLLGLTAAFAAGVPVVVHAEDPGSVTAAGPGPGGWLASRPPVAEVLGVRTVVDAAARSGGRAHVLHLSAGEALDELAAARAGGAAVTAETCPHYLSLAAEEVVHATSKCAPPIRPGANRAALFDGLRDGLLSAVVSDHSPSSPDLKAGDFADAWGGVSGLQTQLPVVWTAARGRGVGLDELARWNSTEPALLAGLPHKGRIAVGCDADLVVWDPEASFVLSAHDLRTRHALSPWLGETLFGVVRRTWLRGVPVDLEASPRGRLLGRETRL